MYQLNDKIKDVKPYDPEMGDTPIHLDANESFLPLPVPILEELAAALPQVAFNRYPDPAARKLCQAFAAYYGVPVENVAAGNGSDELITVLFTGFPPTGGGLRHPGAGLLHVRLQRLSSGGPPRPHPQGGGLCHRCGHAPCKPASRRVLSC